MSARRAAVAAIAVFTVSAAPASARVDRKAPSKPTNLRLTGTTTTTISIAWDAATDNSGKLSYEMHLWRDPRVPVVPQTQTSFTWTELRPSVEYYLSVVAIDAAGNKTFSDQLIVRTPRDTIAPQAPTNLRVDSVSASQVALSWNPAFDESAVASYAVFTSTGQIVEWARGTSRKVIGLPPNRQFTFYVKARDYGGNVSPASETVTATTLASNDTTAPSAPSLWVWGRGRLRGPGGVERVQRRPERAGRDPLPALAGIAVTQTTAAPSWVGVAGIVIGPVLMLCSLEFAGSHEPTGWKLAERLTPITYIAWSLWLIATGVTLLA